MTAPPAIAVAERRRVGWRNGLDAHVLHWYASVADLAPLDEKYIEGHRDTSVYAQLCAPFLP